MPAKRSTSQSKSTKKAAATRGKTSAKAASSKSAESASGNEDAIALLKADHRKVEQLFDRYEQSEDTEEKSEIVYNVCKELIIHTMLEEELFYPACREELDDDSMLDEAQVEHDAVKALMVELAVGSPEDEFYDAKVKVLSEYVKHHIREEEKRGDGIFAQAKSADMELESLGEEIRQMKEELLDEVEERGIPRPDFIAFQRIGQMSRTRRGRGADYGAQSQVSGAGRPMSRQYGQGGNVGSYGAGMRGSNGGQRRRERSRYEDWR